MKTIILVLIICIGFTSTNAQSNIGSDFVVDNIINPLINDIRNNTINFLWNTITSSLFGGLFGKRDSNAAEEINVIMAMYQQRVDAVFQKMLTGLKQLNKGLILQFLESLKQEIKNESAQLLTRIFNLLQKYFGQILNDQGKSVFLNITNVVNNFTLTLLNTINNAGKLMMH